MINLPMNDAPVQEVYLGNAKIRILIKREDLLHPDVPGNKLRKLYYNLQQASRQQADTLLTFGGAYSNHIAATAVAGKLTGFRTIGIIRGEPNQNPTLNYARRQGMHLHFISREQYREKESEEFVNSLREKLGDFYLIPEGGTNKLAVQGCMEIVHDLKGTAYDYLCCCCGTGGTLAGLVASAGKQVNVLGFSVLKGFAELDNLVKDKVKEATGQDCPPFFINHDFHFGGYAKASRELVDYINTFRQTHRVQLDPVYTGKMFYGVETLINENYFPEGSTLVLVHSGGLQGIAGFNERYGKKKGLTII
jgi:1-aminocyclopropane-1-carboxylate deaminase